MIEHKENINKNIGHKTMNDDVISGELFGDDNISVSLYFWNQIIMNENKPSYLLRFGTDFLRLLLFGTNIELNYLIYLKNGNGLQLIQNYSDKGMLPLFKIRDKLTSFYVPSNELQNNQISLSISTVTRVRNILSKDSVTSNNQIRFLIQLDKNLEKQKNSLTLKNYFSGLTINLKNKKNTYEFIKSNSRLWT